MDKYVVTINNSANTKIYLMGNSVTNCEKYSVLVDDSVVTFEYPVSNIEKIDEIPTVEKKTKRHIIKMADGDSYSIDCINGRYNPEDPYTFLHDGGCLEFQKPIIGIEVVALTEQSNKNKISEDAKRRQEGNTPVQSKYVRHFFRPFEIEVFLDRLYLYALEKEMWTEAANINFIKNDEKLKLSRRTVGAINTIKEYDIILSILNDIVADRKRFPIDEFWQAFFMP